MTIYDTINVNELTLGFKEFPNRELNLPSEDIISMKEIFENNNDILVKFRFYGNSDIIKLVLLNNFFKQEGYDKTHNINIILKFVPYSRMDRIQSNNIFSLKMFIDLFNSTSVYKDVYVWEAHSQVTFDLLEENTNHNVISVPTTLLLLKHYIRNYCSNINKDDLLVVLPDKGSEYRYKEFLDYNKLNYITANKERDFETGRIKSLKFNGNPNLSGKSAVIIDDICSYGGTAVLTAFELTELGASNIDFIVTHLEENSYLAGNIPRGFGGNISRTFASNSIVFDNHDDISDKLIIVDDEDINFEKEFVGSNYNTNTKKVGK